MEAWPQGDRPAQPSARIKALLRHIGDQRTSFGRMVNDFIADLSLDRDNAALEGKDDDQK